MVVLGSFLDWVTVLNGAIGRSGTDAGAGWVSFTLGIAMVGIAVAQVAKKGIAAWAVFGLVGSAGAVGLALYEIQTINDHDVELGSGLIVILLAGFAGAVLSLIAMLVRVPETY